jgi:arylsulfatase
MTFLQTLTGRALLILGMTLSAITSASETRPNFLLIVMDDLGYSDLGSFGGEIRTPNLDKLALEGIRLTNFYAAAACSPSRAMLLTGVDSHQVGLGNMAEYLTDEQKGKPGYEGYLNDRAETLAQKLRSNGYHSYMSGKWHLGSKPGTLPGDRGFERSFALMEGGANHFDQRGVTTKHPVADYREQDKPVALPKDFYSSKTYTDKLIEYLNADQQDGKPFFAYLAYTAPHWPLQAPRNYIDKYKGKYALGYDELRQRRLDSMERLQILSKAQLDAGFSINEATGYHSWKQLNHEERRRQARLMEVYAAMVESTDAQVGRVLDLLRERGELDNTVVVFMSDNGAEGFDKSEWPGLDAWVERFDGSTNAIGSKDSFSFYGAGWGIASTAPYRLFKGFGTDGGLRTPAFFWSPTFHRQKAIGRELVTVMDIAPTILELAGVNAAHKPTPGQRGKSMLAYLNGQAEKVHQDNEAIAWELMGNAAVRKGNWKLVRSFKPFGSGEWELFDVSKDPAETRDLAEAYPQKYRELVQDWGVYARENGIVLPEWGWKDRLMKAYLFGTGAL